ncbi:phragmoplastin interacting protein 1 [Argentina anserina]|uniref:phragmoplastin interacting protein 1 n=1 Tax=Argentina anserina TaxID=57926 RepID=UPI00217660A6|nr:phragmoplastin interacting protein 1 [Potentilla anserina]
MVLSNRKLKQQLREKISDSLLTFEIVKSDPSSNDGSANPDPNPQQPQSLRALLGSATPKPSLSKRAKRRKLAALRGPAASGGGDLGENDGVEKTEALGLEGNGILKKENGSESKKKKEKKEKKRKRDEEEKSGDLGLEGNGDLEIGDESLGKEKKRKIDEEEKSEDLSSEGNGVGVKEEGKKPKKKKPKWKKKKEVKSEEEKGFEVVREEQSVNQTDKETERQENGEVATKVYVGGIPYYSTEDDIRSFLESCGSITEVDCMRFLDSGKFKGIAIISFRTEAAAKRALALDGADMGGLFLKILPYKSTRVNKVVNKVSDFAPKIVEGYNRIYVGNLSWDITEDELRKLFSDCKISSINFGMDKETGEFRGYAHVEFSDSLSLTMALKLDQKVVLGRPVKISCAVPLRKSGIHPKSVSTSTGTLSEAVATTASAGADNDGLSAISGKLKRRTCYECGEKGHVSSLCPLKRQVNTVNATDTNASYTKPVMTTGMLLESVTKTTEAANTELSSVSGKTKRRTCYECGEKGHVSTACPQKQSAGAVTDSNATPTTPVHTITSPVLEPIAIPSSTGVDNTGLNSISGKIKRRTCYECGEKGHVSTACPNKQYAHPIETTASHTKQVLTTPTPLLESASTTTGTEPDNAGLSSMSGKIKRRTCYECGEKGHISSACPKKQSVDNNAS